MSGICDTCHREPCHMRFDGCQTCDVYEGGETRYERLFGTPERAARTLSIMQRCELGIIGNCDDCEMHDACRVRDGDYDVLLEWLRGESE